MGSQSCNCILPDGDEWVEPWLHECDYHRAQRGALERARGALADIHASSDMTLRIARKKAGRIYAETEMGETRSAGACVRRPEIGTMVVVCGYTPKPFKARVRDYHQLSSDCVRVTQARTAEEWVVLWRQCEVWKSPTARKEKRRWRRRNTVGWMPEATGTLTAPSASAEEMAAPRTSAIAGGGSGEVCREDASAGRR